MLKTNICQWQKLHSKVAFGLTDISLGITCHFEHSAMKFPGSFSMSFSKKTFYIYKIPHILFRCGRRFRGGRRIKQVDHHGWPTKNILNSRLSKTCLNHIFYIVFSIRTNIFIVYCAMQINGTIFSMIGSIRLLCGCICKACIT